ncbi:M48 family metallopeptidase [Enterococcus faecalis]|uniref:M48 family metallopeptidase n=1 Tax=Enterococcus faecalis TaxID=1351 RepID=UPI0029367F8C|nr:M48 family metallopeptidase [Enterococcus faecalis]MDV2550940.1 M48 family metallopeptidase [Enterococcus faecalis]
MFMCQPQEKKKEISVAKLRYRFELPMIIIGFVLLFLALGLVALLILSDLPIPDWLLIVLIAPIAPVIAFFTIRYMYMDTASNGVEITENQLPEIYSLYIDLAKEMGFGTKKLRMPRLYLINGNGVLNAFAAKCSLHRRYVVIHSDLLDIAYNTGDFSLIRFILAHELGHHKCGHTNLWRLMLSIILKPVALDKSFTRTQEYTADRAGLYYAEEGALSMIYLFSGKYMGSRVDLEEYFHSIDLHDDTIWLKLSNFLSDHPVGFRRMQTLKKSKDTGNWDVHGKFF